MTTQPENKDKAEQKVSKDELSEKEPEKATGGKVQPHDMTITKFVDKSSPRAASLVDYRGGRFLRIVLKSQPRHRTTAP